MAEDFDDFEAGEEFFGAPEAAFDVESLGAELAPPAPFELVEVVFDALSLDEVVSLHFDTGLPLKERSPFHVLDELTEISVVLKVSPMMKTC